MRGFWTVEFLLLNSQEEYVLTFNILALLSVPTNSTNNCTTINSSSNIHQVPSLRDIMAS
jgi:hypothetical protein